MRRAGFLLALLLAGCLEFEEQLVEFSYDKSSDRVTVFLVYHGLWYEGGGDANARAALERAVSGKEICLFGWPLHLQPAELKRKGSALGRFLVESLTSDEIGFFEDARGRLSGGQIVTVHEASRLVQLTNDAINALINGAPAASSPEWDRETEALFREAARRGHAWVRLRGNAIEVHGFCSDRDFERLKRDGLESLLQEWKEDKLQGFEWIVRNPVSFLREGKSLRLVLGNPEGRSRFVLPLRTDKPYEPNLLAFARERYGFRLDGAVAPYLLEPQKTLPEPVIRAHIAQLAADDPGLREQATRALAEAEGNDDLLAKLHAGASTEVRRRLGEIRRQMNARVRMRRFAEALPLMERVRILLARGEPAATSRLEREVARLPDPPKAPPEDARAFWRKRLEEAR